MRSAFLARPDRVTPAGFCLSASGQDNNGYAQLNEVIQFNHVRIAHAHAAMRNCLADQMVVGGAMKANGVGAIRPKANPPSPERIVRAGGNHFSGERMLPGGMWLLLKNREGAGGGFPFMTPDRDVIGDDFAIAVVAIKFAF